MNERSAARAQQLQTASLDCGESRQSRPDSKRALLSLEDAIAVAISRVRPIGRTEKVSLANSIGRRLSRPLTARFDLPPFNQSAMDGYALAGQGESDCYTLAGGKDARAGDRTNELQPGQAARISTGARIPDGVDRVVLREHAYQRDDCVVVSKGGVSVGTNIRLRGEDVRQGDVLLPRGDKIDARKVALFAAQGMTSVEVLSAPRVAVISSGNELRQPGQSLGAADVFDCNTPMLIALAVGAGAEVIDEGWSGDDTGMLGRLVAGLSVDNDFIVISGGSSLGEADVTSAALRSIGAKVDELQIAMKPGKPALVGQLGKTNIIGLPGNPFAAFVSWFTLGRSMMAAMFDLQHEVLTGRELQVLQDLRRRPGRTEFIPARQVRTERGIMLEFLGPAGSGRLLPLCRADGLARIDAARGNVFAGECVAFIPFGDGET